MKHEMSLSVTTVSHVKLEKCVLKVQVTVRLLFHSCQRKILEMSLQGNQHDWLLQKFFNTVVFRKRWWFFDTYMVFLQLCMLLLSSYPWVYVVFRVVWRKE